MSIDVAIPPRPIETRYRGYRFRSRLEARWAVFFDAANWRWEYEPEGFDLPSGPYLPDFRVSPQSNMWWWWEIKPDRGPGNRRSGVTIDPRWIDLVRSSHTPLLVAHGLPRHGHSADVWLIMRDPDDKRHLLVAGWRSLSRFGAALDAARAARFEHRSSDPSAEPAEGINA